MRYRHFLPLALVVTTFVACKKKSDPTAPGTPTFVAAKSLVTVQGDTQTAQASTQLPVPIVVRALDASGHPAPGNNIQFIVGGGGTVTPSSVATDSLGQATAKWTLGPTQPNQTLAASAAGTSSVTLHATALFPTSSTLVQGGAQTAKAGTLLPVPIIIRVTGPNNTPMVGITVTTQVSSGSSVTPTSGVTDASGQFSVKWTTSPVPGSNTLTLQAGTLPAITVTATGN